MSNKAAPTQPARKSDRIQGQDLFEKVDFVKRRDKRRRANELAKKSRRKNRK